MTTITPAVIFVDTIISHERYFLFLCSNSLVKIISKSNISACCFRTLSARGIAGLYPDSDEGGLEDDHSGKILRNKVFGDMQGSGGLQTPINALG